MLSIANSSNNTINLGSKGAVPVAIFGSELIDVSQIDLNTIQQYIIIITQRVSDCDRDRDRDGKFSIPTYTWSWGKRH